MTLQLASPAAPRFAFGANWRRFLATLTPERIATAERSLREMLALPTLAGRRFLDIGSGSGLFSLAARRLGARVHSFDYDPEAVACTAALRQRFFPDDPAWTVERGDVLDAAYIASLGTFDVVYAWGVLHPTGDLWRALDHAQRPVAPGGWLYIAIYNDQGWRSALWRRIKWGYNVLPAVLFSAAVPLQGGIHHVNEQWPDYWVTKFHKYRYSVTDPIRPVVWQDERVEFWYAQNVLFIYLRRFATGTTPPQATC